MNMIMEVTNAFLEVCDMRMLINYFFKSLFLLR